MEGPSAEREPAQPWLVAAWAGAASGPTSNTINVAVRTSDRIFMGELSTASRLYLKVRGPVATVSAASGDAGKTRSVDCTSTPTS